MCFSNVIFFKFLFIYLILERGREGERKGEKHQCVVASPVPSTGDLACNPGMCPDWESNQWPFGSQARTQSTEPHQPGLLQKCLIMDFKLSGDLFKCHGLKYHQYADHWHIYVLPGLIHKIRSHIHVTCWCAFEQPRVITNWMVQNNQLTPSSPLNQEELKNLIDPSTVWKLKQPSKTSQKITVKD